MRGQDLSDFTRGQIFALHFHAEWTYKNISTTLHLPIPTVKSYCQRARQKFLDGESAGGDRKGNCGRHACLDERIKRRMKRISVTDPFKTVTDISNNLQLPCSIRTAQSSMNKMGLKAYTPAHKTRLTDNHKHARFQWSITYLHWTTDHWMNVAFSDESKFVVGAYHARYVRRRVGERYEDKCIEKGENRGRGSVMVWGTFSYYGSSNLVLIEGRATAQDYVNMLNDNLIPNLQTLLPNGGFFQQDNAPIHTARLTTQWLLNQNIQVLPHPPLSPDMNPIENVWHALALSIQQQIILNSEDLFIALSNAWRDHLAIPQVRLNYIESMTRRVRSLHAAHGSYTRY